MATATPAPEDPKSIPLEELPDDTDELSDELEDPALDK